MIGAVGRAQAGSETDLQEVAADIGQEPLAVLGQGGQAQQAAAEPGQDEP
jgi:hypothetical protein